MKKLGLLSVAIASSAIAFGTSLNNGESIAFLGDSITQQGWGDTGYVRLCQSAFAAAGKDVNIIPAGISGNKSNNMLERLDRDVLKKSPTYMTLSCGVNDVWHADWGKGISLEDYKKNISEIISRAQAEKVKVIILTATMIGEDANADKNKKLVPYNDFLREVAKEKGCFLVDLNKEMQKRVADFRAKTGNNGNFLTGDGVHMNLFGNKMMASMILKDGFAFTEEELKKAEEQWLNSTISVSLPQVTMKISDYMKIAEKGISENKTPVRAVADKMGSLKNQIDPIVTEMIKNL